MSAENRVSLSITEDELQTVQNAVKTIQESLGVHLIALKSEEVKALPKMSDKSIPFVEKVIDYSASDPQFMPQFVDAQELRKDMEAVKSLATVLRPLEQLIDGVRDTMTLAGSEAYKAALAYYQAVKQAAKMNVSGARAVFEDLNKRFPNPKTESKTNTISPTA